jgi:hypothetical protein
MKKQSYRPPKARNLSAMGAYGQFPLGICSSGYTPYPACSQGDYVGVACDPGTAPGSGTECFSYGSTASNTCKGGTYA